MLIYISQLHFSDDNLVCLYILPDQPLTQAAADRVGSNNMCIPPHHQTVRTLEYHVNNSGSLAVVANIYAINIKGGGGYISYSDIFSEVGKGLLFVMGHLNVVYSKSQPCRFGPFPPTTTPMFGGLVQNLAVSLSSYFTPQNPA